MVKCKLGGTVIIASFSKIEVRYSEHVRWVC